MRPIQVLKDEHRVIEKVLDCLDQMAAACEREKSLDAETAQDVVSFFQGYADKCHHAKEEDKLFPMMESRGFSPSAGPTAVMRIEHTQGRELVGRMASAIDGAAEGDAAAVAAYVENARKFSALLRQHIQKEDHCLFSMAEQALTESEQSKLAVLFDNADNVELGAGVKAEFENFAVRLQEKFAAAG